MAETRFRIEVYFPGIILQKPCCWTIKRVRGRIFLLEPVYDFTSDDGDRPDRFLLRVNTTDNEGGQHDGSSFFSYGQQDLSPAYGTGGYHDL